MSDVQFEENNFSDQRVRLSQGKASVFVRFLLKKGIVKTEKGANYLLLTIAVSAFVASFFILNSQ